MALPYIWSEYKKLEQNAHHMVFTKHGIPQPTQLRELTNGIGSFFQTCNKQDRKKIQALIRDSLVLREEAGKIYGFRQKCAEQRGDTETSSRLRRSICKHAYYFSLMNSLLPERARITWTCALESQHVKMVSINNPILTGYGRFACLNPKEDVGVPSEVRPEKISNSPLVKNRKTTNQEDFSLDEDDLENFCITLETGLDEMLDTLKRMNEGQITPDFAFVVMNCVYKEISSTLTMAELLAPHWFNNKFLDRKDASFYDINILKQLQMTPANIRKDLFSNNVATSTLKMDHSIAPRYMVDFMKLMHKIDCGQVSGSTIFHFSVLRHLLCLTQSSLNYRHLIELRVSTSQYLNYVHKTISHPYARQLLGGDVIHCGQELKRQGENTQSLKEPSLLCGLSYWGTYQLHEVSLMLLETPLITMTAHIYVYVRLAYKQDLSPTLDSFCKKHASMLFWNGLPQDLDSWCDSYKNFVTPIRKIAQSIAQRRSSTCQDDSILKSLRATDFKLYSSTLNRFQNPNKALSENLKVCLESQVPMNTFCLYEKVSEIARYILYACQADHEITHDILDNSYQTDDETTPYVLDGVSQADLEIACRFFQNRDRVAKPFILELDKALVKENLFPYVSCFRTKSSS